MDTQPEEVGITGHSSEEIEIIETTAVSDTGEKDVSVIDLTIAPVSNEIVDLTQETPPAKALRRSARIERARKHKIDSQILIDATTVDSDDDLPSFLPDWGKNTTPSQSIGISLRLPAFSDGDQQPTRTSPGEKRARKYKIDSPILIDATTVDSDDDLPSFLPDWGINVTPSCSNSIGTSIKNSTFSIGDQQPTSTSSGEQIGARRSKKDRQVVIDANTSDVNSSSDDDFPIFLPNFGKDSTPSSSDSSEVTVTHTTSSAASKKPTRTSPGKKRASHPQVHSRIHVDSCTYTCCGKGKDVTSTYFRPDIGKESRPSSRGTGFECPICFDGYEEIKMSNRTLMSTSCGHVCCDVCIERSTRSSKKCPLCRKSIQLNRLRPLYF